MQFFRATSSGWPWFGGAPFFIFIFSQPRGNFCVGLQLGLPGRLGAREPLPVPLLDLEGFKCRLIGFNSSVMVSDFLHLLLVLQAHLTANCNPESRRTNTHLSAHTFTENTSPVGVRVCVLARQRRDAASAAAVPSFLLSPSITSSQLPAFNSVAAEFSTESIRDRQHQSSAPDDTPRHSTQRFASHRHQTKHLRSEWGLGARC